MAEKTMGLWRKNGIPGGKYLVQRRDGSIPEWPLFVLGAKDPGASVALRAYADAVDRLGKDRVYVRQLADEFDDYRAVNNPGLKGGAHDNTAYYREDRNRVLRACVGLARELHLFANSSARHELDQDAVAKLAVLGMVAADLKGLARELDGASPDATEPAVVP